MTYKAGGVYTYRPLGWGDYAPNLASLKGNGTLWPLIVENDGAIYQQYTPGFEGNPDSLDTALAREYRFRFHGNLDNAQLAIGVRAIATGGPHAINLSTGIDTGALAITADAWYSDTLLAEGPIQEVIVSVPAAASMRVQAIRINALHGEPSLRTFSASGYRVVDELFVTANYPISSGTISRLKRNLTRVAIDRPVCVACHISDTLGAITVKSEAVWGVENSTAYSRVGRMIMPRVDPAFRRYRFDAYTVESAGEQATYAIRVGGVEEVWSGVGWHSWTAQLGPGPHEVYANILPGAVNEASIRTFQVWRSEL